MTTKRKRKGKNNTSLIVFAKNPILGKTKTRIARKSGKAMALDIYDELLQATQELCKLSPFPVLVYYSDFLDTRDGWFFAADKFVQVQHQDLGERISKAFDSVLSSNDHTIIIGSDCPFLSVQHIQHAADLLIENDAVIGPSEDGGFYLLGLNKMDGELFHDIIWSTDKVTTQLEENLERLNWSYNRLERLRDIDEYEDYVQWQLARGQEA